MGAKSEDSDKEISLTIVPDVFVGTRYLSLPDATIKVRSINVQKSNKDASGTYWVTSDGGSEVEVDFSKVGDIIPYHANIEWSI